jgi:DNA replication protein DnaC
MSIAPKPSDAAASNDMLEMMEDRHGRDATLITSQLPAAHWHQAIGDPTLADAILDRLLHNATKLQVKGKSMRKKQTHVDHP